MKFNVLNEMAYSRQDLIEKCSNLGLKFIEHFKKVYQGGLYNEKLCNFKRQTAGNWH